MKRFAILLCALLLLLPAGCQKAPTVTKDGEGWSEDWTLVGATLGVEPPGNGLALLDNKDALAASGLYYAAWAAGEQVEYDSGDGETASMYEAQLYLLLQDCKSGDEAAANVADWRQRAEESYQVTETRTVTCAGQAFTVLLYRLERDNGLSARGAAALAVYGDHAIDAEISCLDSFEGDVLTILAVFLDGIHYA